MNCSFELYKFPAVNNFHEYTIFWKRENSREIIRRGVDIRNRDNRFVFRANLLTLRVNWRWKNGQISSSQKKKPGGRKKWRSKKTRRSIGYKTRLRKVGRVLRGYFLNSNNRNWVANCVSETWNEKVCEQR